MPIPYFPWDPAVADSLASAASASAQTEQALRALLDDDAVPEWTEEDIVVLHWRLLLELRRLPNPEMPLEEKLDTLAWALTDPALDDRPFSFANSLRVVGTSPLSPTAYFGLVQIDEIRAWLRANARNWMRETLERYPSWIRDLIREQPAWVAKQLAKNPQWLNEQIKLRENSHQQDLFSSPGLLLARG
jgi:hypothetical protein